jgi:hypothetical protein
MEDENKVVEPATPEVVQDESKEEEVVTTQDDDLLAKLEELRAENERIAKDRDNYRQGMLSKEAKLKAIKHDDWGGEEEDTESSEEKFRSIAREELANSKLQENEAEQAALIEKMGKELKETKLALRNRAQSSVRVGGGESGGEEVQQGYFSQAQLQELKAKGFHTEDPEVMKTLEKNMREAAGLPAPVSNPTKA